MDGLGELLVETTPGLTDLALLIGRVFIGVCFVIHGLGKLGVVGAGSMPGFVQYLESLGVPMAPVQARMAMLSELVGGSLLALGLFTRPACLLLVFTMLVAGRLGQGRGRSDTNDPPGGYTITAAICGLRAARAELPLDKICRHARASGPSTAERRPERRRQGAGSVVRVADTSAFKRSNTAGGGSNRLRGRDAARRRADASRVRRERASHLRLQGRELRRPASAIGRARGEPSRARLKSTGSTSPCPRPISTRIRVADQRTSPSSESSAATSAGSERGSGGSSRASVSAAWMRRRGCSARSASRRASVTAGWWRPSPASTLEAARATDFSASPSAAASAGTSSTAEGSFAAARQACRRSSASWLASRRRIGCVRRASRPRRAGFRPRARRAPRARACAGARPPTWRRRRAGIPDRPRRCA